MTTARELIPSPLEVRKQLGYHLREVRLLRKLLRVSEAAADERRPLEPIGSAAGPPRPERSRERRA